MFSAKSKLSKVQRNTHRSVSYIKKVPLSKKTKNNNDRKRSLKEMMQLAKNPKSKDIQPLAEKRMKLCPIPSSMNGDKFVFEELHLYIGELLYIRPFHTHELYQEIINRTKINIDQQTFNRHLHSVAQNVNGLMYLQIDWHLTIGPRIYSSHVLTQTEKDCIRARAVNTNSVQTTAQMKEEKEKSDSVLDEHLQNTSDLNPSSPTFKKIGKLTDVEKDLYKKECELEWKELKITGNSDADMYEYDRYSMEYALFKKEHESLHMQYKEIKKRFKNEMKIMMDEKNDAIAQQEMIVKLQTWMNIELKNKTTQLKNSIVKLEIKTSVIQSRVNSYVLKKRKVQ